MAAEAAADDAQDSDPRKQHQPDTRRGLRAGSGARTRRCRGSVGRHGDRPVSDQAWSRQEFEQRLREKGRAYHIHHPFNVMLNSGKATAAQIRGWVANRFYYQINIPIKDAAILANCTDRAVRRAWVQRILDHDGYADDPGGIESWIRLAQATGLTREHVESLVDVIPGVRFAV